MKRSIVKEGQIVKIVANRYTVAGDGKVYTAFARGRLRLGEDIFVGDMVEFEVQKPLSVICRVLPRKNKLIRPYVANIDKAIIVIAKEPEPDLLLLDKILLNCYKEGIDPVICYNKTDLADPEEIENTLKPYKEFAETVKVSSLTGENIEKLGRMIEGSLACLAGQSAVGKTSILNSLAGLSLKTDELSQRIKRGKNTTRHVEIFEAAGGRIADTCGFSMLETVELEPGELIYYYPEFLPLQNKCKYKSCTHTAEPDCAVKEALKEGGVDKGRYERYTFIYNELKEFWDKKYE